MNAYELFSEFAADYYEILKMFGTEGNPYPIVFDHSIGKIASSFPFVYLCGHMAS